MSGNGLKVKAIVLLQEHHLTQEPLRQEEVAVSKAGYDMFAFPAARRGRSIQGGVAVVTRKHVGGHLVHHHSQERCGFVVVAMRISGTDTIVVSLYLQCSIGLTSEPNVSILAELLALVKKWKGPWFVAGDWNVNVSEVLTKRIAEHVGAVFLYLGESSIEGGPNELDFGLASRRLASVLTVHHDWGVPLKPHAALQFDLKVSRLTMHQPHCQTCT